MHLRFPPYTGQHRWPSPAVQHRPGLPQRHLTCDLQICRPLGRLACAALQLPMAPPLPPPPPPAAPPTPIPLSCAPQTSYRRWRCQLTWRTPALSPSVHAGVPVQLAECVLAAGRIQACHRRWPAGRHQDHVAPQAVHEPETVWRDDHRAPVSHGRCDAQMSGVPGTSHLHRSSAAVSTAAVGWRGRGGSRSARCPLCALRTAPTC